MNVTQTRQTTSACTDWIKGLDRMMRLSSGKTESGLRTTLSSDMRQGKLALYIPTEIARHQPDNLRYLHTLASRRHCALIEDRRESSITPLVEQRDMKPMKMAKALCSIIDQTNANEIKTQLSVPHRLATTNRRIELTRLLSMVAFGAEKSKHVAIRPNAAISEATGNNIKPINVFACKIVSPRNTTIVSYFSAEGFKAIGYVANKQFIAHVLIGGGTIRSPQIWANNNALTRNKFRFQLYRGPRPRDNFALLYNTFYLDLP